MLQKSKFVPYACCKAYQNKNDNAFELKLEFVSNLGFLKETNKLSFRNTMTGAQLIKCSGSTYDESLSHVVNNISLTDLNALWQN